MAKIIFWFSFAASFYTFASYPILVWLLAHFRGRKPAKQPITPTVSVVIACFNEEQNIEARINNLLQSEYPQENLEIIIVSDGSTDRTVKIARFSLRETSRQTSGVKYRRRKCHGRNDRFYGCAPSV
jgi:cellulose synthase/poly-beta-1,6-N-acetylglucosamine synthase-like glycosyltransferase